MKAICTPESKHGTVMARLQHLIFVVALAHCTPPLQRAYLIALGNATLLQRSLEHNLRLPRDSIHVWTAVNATRATPDSVTLYAQHTIAHGRHDHMQLGSLPALGCLLSHMQVWQHMLTQPEDEVAIFEEDAWPREDAHMLVQGVRADAWRWASNWTLLKLTTEAGHRVVESGRWQYHTPRLASCATKGGCVTFGTRGYLLRRRGAQVLLRQVGALDVQVDALLSLVDAYDPEFRMLWSTQSMCVEPVWLQHSTTVWDGCLKCFITPLTPYYLILGVCIVALLVLHRRHKKMYLA